MLIDFCIENGKTETKKIKQQKLTNKPIDLNNNVSHINYTFTYAVYFKRPSIDHRNGVFQKQNFFSIYFSFLRKIYLSRNVFSCVAQTMIVVASKCHCCFIQCGLTAAQQLLL